MKIPQLHHNKSTYVNKQIASSTNIMPTIPIMPLCPCAVHAHAETAKPAPRPLKHHRAQPTSCLEAILICQPDRHVSIEQIRPLSKAQQNATCAVAHVQAAHQLLNQHAACSSSSSSK
jgi:hypothetical protein